MQRPILFFLLLLFSCASSAQQVSVKKEVDSLFGDRPLKVGVKHSPPFMVKSDKGYKAGVSHDLWKNIAEDLGLEYQYKEYDLVGLLNAVEKGEIDLCINPLTVTSRRLEKMDFSQPFYISNLAIAAPYKNKSDILLFLANFFSYDFLKAVLLLIVVLFIFGFLLWALEKRANPEMFRQGAKGIWDGFWWSAVTMTTVGYGDKAPTSTAGKLVALVWMFTAVIIISSFTASIASSLTVQKTSVQISNLSDLKHVRCGTVQGSNSEAFLDEKAIGCNTYASLEEGLQALGNDKLDAFVYDEPLLRYVIQEQQLKDRIKVLANTFNKQNYSMATPKGSPLLDHVNRELLEELEDENWQSILRRYDLKN